MATLTPVPMQAVPVLRRKRNTLQILSLSRAVLFTLSALLLLAILGATYVHRHSMQKIGKDTAPSIIAAQEIKTAAADMDAEAVDDLLSPDSTRFSAQYNKRRLEASDALIVAAKNITYASEEQPIESLNVSLENYQRLIQEARDLQDEEHDLADAARQEKEDMVVRYYRAAGIVMDGTVLTSADELDKANFNELDDEYKGHSTWAFSTRTLVLLLGLALLAGLVWVQMFLNRRMRRTLNPALLAATVVAFALTVLAYGSMQREQGYLHSARADAFDSVYALLQARAIGFAANSEESRFLLDPLHKDEYEADFKRNAERLAKLPEGMTANQLLAELRSGDKVPGFTGLLADELNNITYVGERESALESVASFEHYLDLDRNLRTLGAASQKPGLSKDEHAALLLNAVSFDVGESDQAFSQFDDALGNTLAINRTEFDRAVAGGFSVLNHLELESFVAVLVMVVLIFFGFAPRIREYQ